jgi:EAL domain-containing protein (putative c-di-GMP-specific phosphodiesterase class I)
MPVTLPDDCAVCPFGAGLGAQVMAEGVETAERAESLMRHAGNGARGGVHFALPGPVLAKSGRKA